MIGKIAKLLYVILGVGFLGYLVLPTPGFPDPPPGAEQSVELGDTETPMRRAYFTNYTREQVVAHYKNQLRLSPFILRLNYPPEEAQTLIRDQARSVYLEELVHPFRGSTYINGFEARVPKDDIWYKGVHYGAKVTIRFVYASVWVRLLLAVPTLVAGYILLREVLVWRKA